MCGIFFSCSLKGHVLPGYTLQERLQKRGPDSYATILRSVPSVENVISQHSTSKMHKTTYSLAFVSSVLSLRGKSIVKQPLEDPQSGSIFCWNGEAWKYQQGAVESNDTRNLFDILLGAANSRPFIGEHEICSDEPSLTSIINAIGSVSGPHAFIFYDAPRQRVFFGRDVLGRRSLLLNNCSLDNFVISSVGDSSQIDRWNEVEPDGVYMLDLAANRTASIKMFDTATRLPGKVHNVLPWSRIHVSKYLVYNMS